MTIISLVHSSFSRINNFAIWASRYHSQDVIIGYNEVNILISRLILDSISLFLIIHNTMEYNEIYVYFIIIIIINGCSCRSF